MAVVAFALATLAGTPPASADTELTVEAGFAGGLYVPGRSVLFLL
jgi:hypothetical protein